MLLDGQSFADDVSVLLDVTPPGWRSPGFRTRERTRAAIAAAQEAAPVHDVVCSVAELCVRVSLLDEPERTLADLRERTRARVLTAVSRAFARPDAAPVAVVDAPTADGAQHAP